MILKPNMSAIPTLGTWRAGSPGPKTAPAKPPAFGKPSGPLLVIIHGELSRRRATGPGKEDHGAINSGDQLFVKSYNRDLQYPPEFTPAHYWRPRGIRGNFAA